MESIFTLYICWVFFFMFSVIYAFKTTSNVRLLLFIYTFILLFFIAGFKVPLVGADDEGYILIFQSDTLSTNMELGYLLLNKIIKIFTDNEQFLFITTSLITLSILSYTLHKMSPHPILSALLYFVHFFLYKDLTQIRNAIASAIVILTLYLLSNKKNMQCFLSFLVGVLFHIVSVLSVLPSLMYLVCKKKLLLCSSVIVFFVPIIYYLAPYIIENISTIPIAYIQQKHSDYMLSEYIQKIDYLNFNNLRLLAITLLGFSLYKKLQKSNRYFEILFLFFCFGILLRFGLIDFGIFAARTASFFTQVDIILIPLYLEAIKNPIIKILMLFIIALSSILILYYNLEVLKIIPFYSNIILQLL